MAAICYKKRSGTGAVQGQLYETKLISLILFRLLQNKDVVQFDMGSNYDGIGSFDDIIIKTQIAGRDRPILILIQAKHKENDGSRLEYDLIKHFYNSLIMIKDRFCVQKGNCDLFNGSFNETDCIFILYTNANYYLESCNRVDINNHLIKNLLFTGNDDSQVFQIEYNETLHEKILEEKFTLLAEHLTKFLNNKSMKIMNDACIFQYHIILAQSVVHISEVSEPESEKCSYRTMTFRPDFFDTEDNILAMLRRKIYEHILKSFSTFTTYNSDKSTIEEQISLFLSEPSAITLSPLIETQIIYENDEINFIAQRPSSDVNKLKEISVSTHLIEEAKAIAAKTILLSLRLRVPVTFGNIDLTIRGNDEKIQSRLNHLLNKINNMCERAILMETFKVVTVDERDGISNVNGDIGGMVGNLFIYDKSSECLKFTENCDSLESNAKYLFDKLHAKRKDLHIYRFHIKAITNCPKLVFDYSNEVREILNKLIVFENQSNQSGVEKILTNEIAINRRKPSNDLVTLDKRTIFLHYHSRVQEWWMEKISSSFLTKTNTFYEETIKNIESEPRMSALHNTFYVNNAEYYKYDFNEDAMTSIISLRDPLTIIVTDMTTLTTMQVICYVKRNKSKTYAVVDLERLLKLPSEDYNELINELSGTEKVIILICNDTERSRILYARLDKLANVTRDKIVIVITDNKFAITTQECFERPAVIKYEKLSLTDLTPKSHNVLIQDSNILFQGYDVSLVTILDDKSVAFIKGTILSNILRKITVKVGKSLKKEKSSKRYEAIKQNEVYVERRICRDSTIALRNLSDTEYCSNCHTVKTFYDIEDQIVLLTSKAGMGKSILLTHLTCKTKECDKMFWIVRINLLEHTDELKKWRDSNTVIDTSKMLNFICQITLKNDITTIHFEECDNKMNYFNESVMDEQSIFELNIFMHFYNEGKIIILFDGFDEICPDYKYQVINLLEVVKSNVRKNKLWVTSRSYNEILPDLERVLGASYVLGSFNNAEIWLYLKTFWRNKKLFKRLNDDQRSVINNSIQKILTSPIRDSGILGIAQGFQLFLNSQNEDLILEMQEAPPYINEGINYSFCGTPLLVYLIADYFTNLIIDFNANDLVMSMNAFRMYEKFIEKKLAIYLQTKHGAKISDPLYMKLYKNELSNSYTKYKSIAAFVILGTTVFRYNCCVEEFKQMPFNPENIKEVNKLIENFKGSEDETGLISYATSDNVPIFIHRTFAEYFATEYICDILKSTHIDIHGKQLLYSAIRYCHPEIASFWIRQKRYLDRELDCIIKKDIKNKNSVIELFSTAWYITHDYVIMTYSVEQCLRLFQSTVDDYESDTPYFLFAVECFLKSYVKIKMIILKEFIARMKPHLKRYFSQTPLTTDATPVDTLIPYLYFLATEPITNVNDDYISSEEES